MPDTWNNFLSHFWEDGSLGLALDYSRMNLSVHFLPCLTDSLQRAHHEMLRLEAGEKVNRSEDRRVGHYWLRAPHRAPEDVRADIEATLDDLRTFIREVLDGKILAPCGEKYTDLLMIGIGGSALGPQMLNQCFGRYCDGLSIRFLDNTDEEGFDDVRGLLGERLKTTLVIVASKSGTTRETSNGAAVVEHWYQEKGLPFDRQVVAITTPGWKLAQLAERRGWRQFPIWDWVGGRTSIFSAVGLLPSGLQGFDWEAFLQGAREMDELTLNPDYRKNPAMLLAAMWYWAGDGQGKRDMVVLPYRDRLGMFPRYLQQLVMESLGKRLNDHKAVVHQGLVVYGNKGTTDQHSFVQQLREGPDNFFVTFIRVLRDVPKSPLELEQGATSGDFLRSFHLGTRDALHEVGRGSMSILMNELTPASLGALVAWFERAVGYYASLIQVNAYDQPGVEAGKAAANRVVRIQQWVRAALAEGQPGILRTAEEIQIAANTIRDREAAAGVAECGHEVDVESVYHILRHLAANPERGVISEGLGGGPDREKFGRA